MNCHNAHSLISDYIDGALQGRELELLTSHLQECDACRDFCKDMQSMVAALPELSEADLGFNCWGAVRERILAAQVVTRRVWWEFALRPIVAAPALALMLLVGLMFLGPLKLMDEAKTETASLPEFRTYIAAHSRMQQQQAFTDPDVTFITGEMQKASLVTYEAK